MKRQGKPVVYLILLGCALLVLLFVTGSFSSRDSHAATIGCVELLRDGSFEAGGEGWAQYSAQGYALISDFNPRSGRLGVYLAGANNANDRISQQVALPPGPITLTANAWWYLATAETAGEFDTLTVSVLSPNGAVLATLATTNNAAQAGVWDELEFDLIDFAGQTVTLLFEAHTDANNISDFYLDDISLVSCKEDVAPTPAATSTSTPSATPADTPLVVPTYTPTATGTPTSSPVATVTNTATSIVSPSGTWTATSTPALQTATPSSTVERGLKDLYLPLITNLGGLS